MEDHRTLHPDLALFVGAGGPAVEPDDADVSALHRLAVRVGQLLVGVVGRAVGDHRHLGHPVAVDHATPADLVAHFVVQLGGLGRTAPDHDAQCREDRCAGLLALLDQVGDIEGCAPADDGGAVPVEGFEGVGSGEGLEQHGGEPHGQHRHQVVGSADMGVGEGDGPDVVGAHVERPGETPAAGDQRLVGVLHAFGVGRGPGRVVDPADRGVGGRNPRGRCGQGGGVAFGQTICDGEERRCGGGALERPCSQRGVVGLAPCAGMHEQRGAGLAEREADLALAVEVDDRILDRAEPGQRDGEDDRVDPGRQLPRDHGSGGDAHGLQARGDPLGPVAELPEGEGLAVRGDEHGVVARGLGPALDQLPHGLGAGEDFAGARGHGWTAPWRFGTTLIAGGPEARWPWQSRGDGGGAGAGSKRGRMGAVAKAKRAGGAHPVVGNGDADVSEDGGGRSPVAMVGLAVAAIFFIWFAVANLNKVKINFWIYDKSEPLILVILIAGLLGALIGALLMRHRTRGTSED